MGTAGAMPVHRGHNTHILHPLGYNMLEVVLNSIRVKWRRTTIPENGSHTQPSGKYVLVTWPSIRSIVHQLEHMVHFHHIRTGEEINVLRAIVEIVQVIPRCVVQPIQTLYIGHKFGRELWRAGWCKESVHVSGIAVLIHSEFHTEQLFYLAYLVVYGYGIS